MRLILSWDEVLTACVEYLHRQGYTDVQKADMNVEKHTEGDYEEQVEMADGVSVALKPKEVKK